MTILAAVFGLFVVSLGLVAMTSPRLMFRFASQFTTQAGLFAAMAIRLVMGVTLILVAPDSRVPQVLRGRRPLREALCEG